MQYGYLILFPAVVVEGPVVTVIAGFLASLGYMKLGVAYVVVVAADLGGDMGYYALGRWGRGGLIQRWGKHIGITPERVRLLEQHFDQHAGKTLLLGKASHGIGGAFLIAAGTARMSVVKFFWYNFLATLPKSALLLLIGYYFGASYNRASKYFDYGAWGLTVLAVVLVAVYYLIRRFARKEEKKEHLL